MEVLQAYGGKCACCGEHRDAFLTVDHVIPFADGGGPRGLRGGGGLYDWLKRNNWPEGFRVLCMNCNFARGQRGYCPHEVERGFIEFPAGGKTHVYVQMDPKMKRALDKALNYCREAGEDINVFFAPVLDSAASKAAKEFSKKKPDAAPAEAV